MCIRDRNKAIINVLCVCVVRVRGREEEREWAFVPTWKRLQFSVGPTYMKVKQVKMNITNEKFKKISVYCKNEHNFS